MNVDFINIKSYLENKEENIYIKMFYYSIIVGVLLIFAIVFSSCKKKNIYYENILYMKDNYVILSIDYNELEPIINKEKVIIIDNKKYNYVIKEINILDSNLVYQVKIDIKNNKELYENVFYKYKILLKEESLLNYIVRVIKGG